ncbi:MAG: hypothetical protein PUK24_05705 [Elusimicrobia bacterium]|nr:hypothetical protein [Elusimicrobiota bacterium]MDY6038904.1 hypothetical protein [Elusimicrobiaceae bacterium]
MDKLKKRILLVLLLLLAAGLLGLGFLLTVLSRPKAHPTQNNNVPADYTQEIPRPQPEENFAAQPYDDRDPNYEAEVELTRLEAEELKAFLPESSVESIQKLNQNPLTRSAAFMLGVNYFQQQYAKKEISEQELKHKMSAFKETLDRMWKRRADLRQRSDNLPQESALQNTPEPSARAAWTEGPCENAVLPPDSPKNLTCRRGEKGFCAFFDNGAPYFCQTNNGEKSYQLNKWGSSITVTRKTSNGRPTAERYYANGELSRATDYDLSTKSYITIWLDKGKSFRLTRIDTSGKILDKYYFTAGKPYVRYPGGNDMGEINGPWELKNGQIFTDGKPLYTLPGPKLAPDVCMIFNGYCPLQKMPYSKNELPSPQMMPEKP